MTSVALKAYAKINLGLSVIGRRADGYHELRTIYQSISLSDYLNVGISRGSAGVKLETKGMDVPAGRDNLAVRAAEALLNELKLKRSVSLRLWKRIPSGSGLGGASSDAAATLLALLHLLKKKLPPDRLLRVAASLGSDVPFFLFGGRALGVGRGEEVYPLPEEPRRSCVVVFPGESVSTADAYSRLHAPLLTSPRTNHNIELFCGRANEGRANERGRDRLGNDFEPLVFESIPQLAAVKKLLFRCGASVASLTGSGSAVFGLFEDRHEAREAVLSLRRPCFAVYLARTVSRREFQAQISGSAIP